MEHPAETDEIHEGILAAVIRIASAGALGPRELVLEFDAARDAVDHGTSACGDLLRRAFAHSLCAEKLKRLVRHRNFDEEQLHPLRRGVELLNGRDDELAEYRKLVIDATVAAARTRTSYSVFGRGVTHSERAAMREIRSALGLSAC